MWYVIHVRAGQEERIVLQCRKKIQEQPKTAGVLERCFIPYYEQKRRYQSGKLEAGRLKALKAIHTPWLLTGNTETQGQMR